MQAMHFAQTLNAKLRRLFAISNSQCPRLACETVNSVMLPQNNSNDYYGYNPFRGRTSNGYLRANFINLFYDFLDRNISRCSYKKLRADNSEIRKIVGLMWNCTDRLPIYESELIAKIRNPDSQTISYQRRLGLTRFWLTGEV